MSLHINDTFTWRVIYRDGSTLNEFDAVNTIGRGFAEVDSANVGAVQLLPLQENAEPLHSVLIPDGATPVFFRRRSIELDPTGREQGRSTVHCIGWKQGDSAVYLFVFDEGSTLLTNDLQAV